jgi:hypothetical protein
LTNKLPEFHYSPEEIGRAVKKERLGGTCSFRIVADGETLVSDNVIDITLEILKAGHHVSLVTNGTLTKQFQKFHGFPKEYFNRILFNFSLHYLELLRTNTLDIFFNNVRFVKSLGCSYYMTLTLYDNYIPHLENIKKICLKELGLIPVLGYARSLQDEYKLLTDLRTEQYLETAKSYGPNSVDFWLKHFMIKRNEFCYAGDWLSILDLSTGILKSCFAENIIGNMFSEPDERIPFEAIGKSCHSPFCLNAPNFLTFGIIPSMQTITFTELRDTGGFSEQMRYFFNSKLAESNKEYNPIKKFWINCKISNLGQ